MQYDSGKERNNFHLMDDDEIFKTYKASPIKSRLPPQESPEIHHSPPQKHDFSEENNEDAFSFSNNNESISKELDFSHKKNTKNNQNHNKTNSLHETPVYNAKVSNKQEFLHPESKENGFGDLEHREQEKTKKKNYNNISNDGRQKSEDERKTVDLKDKVSHNLKTLYAQIMKNNGEYKNRWDFLYDMSKTQREALNIIREAKKKENENDPELTFKPQLHSKNKMSSNFHERNKIWSDTKREKIENKKKNDQDKDLVHCTFQPMLNDYNSKIINFNSNKYSLEGKGVEQFLRRQILARQAKEEKQALMAHLFFAQDREREERKPHKSTNITFPKEFRLGNSNMKCPSMKKDFQKALSPTKYNEMNSLPTQENDYQRKIDINKLNEEKLKDIFQNPNDIHMEKIPFGQALRELHGELHKLDLEME